jgi:hypothetical protein
MTRLQRFLASLLLAESEMCVAVEREVIRSYRTWASLEEFILAQLGLSPGAAKVCAVYYVGGTERRELLVATTRVKAMVEVVTVFEVYTS